ncbi:MAG: flagellar hook-basal body complex protein FliE [Aquabacterium sp.]
MSDNLVTLMRTAQLHIEGEARQIAASAPGLSHADGEPAGAGFGHVMQTALERVNAQDQAAGDRMTAVETGQSDDLVGAMIASQEASLSFAMLMQARNKVMGAMDELIKLPL